LGEDQATDWHIDTTGLAMLALIDFPLSLRPDASSDQLSMAHEFFSERADQSELTAGLCFSVAMPLRLPISCSRVRVWFSSLSLKIETTASLSVGFAGEFPDGSGCAFIRVFASL
jgi:hypothetical protein